MGDVVHIVYLRIRIITAFQSDCLQFVEIISKTQIVNSNQWHLVNTIDDHLKDTHMSRYVSDELSTNLPLT